MAKDTPWSDRSGAQRRRTLGGFALLYAAIFLVAVVLGWIAIAVVFGLLTLGLGIGRYVTEPDTAETTELSKQDKPAWMAAMDDPDAPDLSRPEYRGSPSDPAAPSSPFDRPGASQPGTPGPPATPPPGGPPSVRRLPEDPPKPTT